MIQNIGKNSKIKIHWKVSPYDFSKERCNSIIAKASKKYGIPKEHIKVEPNFIVLNENGEKLALTNDIIENIQDPQFQLKLFQEYLTINDIVDYDFELIKSIDAEINAKIDYTLYDKYRKYSINWIKWDNFLSYGDNNMFDFTKLNGLVLLNGDPANQSGKTTFAIDLIHFLLFGKTEKSATQDKIFNKHIPEATKVTVEGSLTIDGENYIIKRELSRPALDKRTSKSRTTQKVSYYRIVNDNVEELEDYIDDRQEENSIKTNKVIKEAIGNETDFDMIICATSSNLDELIEKKDTERGRLLSRWIGLMPIEEKDVLAREKFNSDIKPSLISNRYNTETLNQEIEAFKQNSKILKQEIAKYVNENTIIDRELTRLEETRNNLMSSKSIIDENILKLDINTLNSSMEMLAEEGKKKNYELESINKNLSEIGDVEFSINEYDNLVEEMNQLTVEIKLQRQKYGIIKQDIENIKKSEFCPTCGRKYEGIDNTEKIKQMEDEMNKIAEDGKNKSLKHSEILEKINNMKTNRELYENKSKLTIKKSAIELNIEQLRNAYKDKKILLTEYNKNHEAIDKNNKLDIEIRNINSNISNKRNIKETNIKYIEKNEYTIQGSINEVKFREELINKIKEETKLLRHWRLYLDMVGRNGISKMVLRKTLPIINAQMTNLLSDVCDFTVEIDITEKNDVMFYLIKDGVKSDLTSGSGFERTAAALALRTVLGNISTLCRMNFLIIDEILGRVAKENFENMKSLYEKMLTNYDFIIQISHLDEIKDWHENIITVSKQNNISKINLIR